MGLLLCASLLAVLVGGGQGRDPVDLGPSSNTSNIQISFSRSPYLKEYQSSIIFDPRGMEHLYFLTNTFLDLILDKGLPPEVLVDDGLEPIDKLNKHRGKLISHFMGVIIVGITGLFLAILVPIVGLIFCCCRCAGRCGSQKGVLEKKKDTCKRVIYGLFMFLVLLVMLFGVVCAFVTNEYVEQGVQALPTSLNHGTDDIDLYLKNTRSEVDTLLIDNFKQLQKRLDNSLDRSGETVKSRLGEVSKAVAVNNLTIIVSRLEEIQGQLERVVQYTGELQQSSGQLHFGLQGVRQNLLQVLSECSSPHCQEQLHSHNFSLLDVTTDMNTLPDLSPIIKNVSALLSENIRDEIIKGKIAFDKLSNTIQGAVNKTIPDIKSKIAKVGNELARIANNISNALTFHDIQYAKTYVRDGEKYLSTYSKYRWYVCLSCCCVILAIVVCFSFGLLCGVCGEKPGNAYSDSGCHRGKGANLLLMGVFLVFLFSFCLLIVTTALFLVGSAAEKIVCDSATNTSNAQLHTAVMLAQKEIFGQFPTSGYQLDFLDILEKCGNNATIYKALGLDQHSRVQLSRGNVLEIANFSEIKNYRERFQVDAKLQDFLHQININPAVTILTPEGITLLERLRDTSISDINFSMYFALAENRLTGVNLMDISKEINEKANYLPPSQGRVAHQLRNIALQLESYETKLVRKIVNTVKQLKTVVQQLQKEAEFNGKNLQNAISQLLEQAQWAQAFITTRGRDELKKLATEFVSEFSALMDRYADHVQYQVEEVVGKCGPVSRASKATLVAVCDEIVQPFNGFWASLGWCSLLSLPGLILAALLSVLYRRLDPYPTPLADTDCPSAIMFSDRDNIPLAHSHRKTGRVERSTYENRNGYIHDYCGETIPLSRTRDFSMGPESPAYPLFAPLSSAPPTAPGSDVGDWPSERANPTLLNEYSKPPPYHYGVQ